MRPVLAATLALLATVALAADPVTVPEGKFADIKTAAPKGTSVVWRVYPPPAQRAPDLAPGRLIFAGKPGTTYLATAITIDFAKQTVTEDEFEVRFAGKANPDPWPGPSPEPKPDPKPGPDPTPPPPPPVTGTLFLVVVEETSSRTPETARVLNDAAFWDGLGKRDVQWRMYDMDSADVVRLGYLPHANKVGVPAVLTLDKTGKVLDVRKLTATADVDAALKGVGR